MLDRMYGQVIRIRNRLYDRGALTIHDLGARTISIGNLTTGGTGKTPLAAFTARTLAEKGEKVCILTRGYGRKDPGRRVLVADWSGIRADADHAGDEPYELAMKLSGKAVIVADRDRVAAAKWARERFGITRFVLDDGFQHRRARRDVDIVCIDATDPFGGRRILPAGRLRERVEGISRADVIVITRADLAGGGRVETIRKELALLAGGTPTFEAKTVLTRIRPLGDPDGSAPGLQPFSLGEVFPFCALGNPDNFFDLLRVEGVQFGSANHFPDHHRYTKKDTEFLRKLAAGSGAQAFITTAKDAVKLSGLGMGLPCYVAEIEMKIENEAAFISLL